MFFTSLAMAAISSVIIGTALKKRSDIGKGASNLAAAAGFVLMVNSTLVAAGGGFVSDMLSDWAELGQQVPVMWKFAGHLLTAVSAALSIGAVALLAAAVFAPRPAK